MKADERLAMNTLFKRSLSLNLKLASRYVEA